MIGGNFKKLFELLYIYWYIRIMYLTLQKKAIELRKKGYSYNLIQKQIPVSKSTLSYWLSKIPFTPNKIVKERVAKSFLQSSLARHKYRMDSMKKIEDEAQQLFSNFGKRDMLLFGLGLYVGEGAKFLQRVRIINSDPRVILFSVWWLEKVFLVPISHFSLTIHLYPDCNVHESLQFWSDLTKIPLTQFRKSQIDLRKNKSGKKHRKLLYGTANLEVNARGKKEFGVELFRRIMGSIDAVFEKSGIIPTEK